LVPGLIIKEHDGVSLDLLRSNRQKMLVPDGILFKTK